MPWRAGSYSNKRFGFGIHSLSDYRAHGDCNRGSRHTNGSLCAAVARSDGISVHGRTQCGAGADERTNGDGYHAADRYHCSSYAHRAANCYSAPGCAAGAR